MKVGFIGLGIMGTPMAGQIIDGGHETFLTTLHEVPQELGKFGVLLHGGWSRWSAVLVSFVSSLTFLVGGVFTWALSSQADLSFLAPFAAGNFLYIGASDLIPEVNRHHRLRTSLVHFASFAAGVALLLLVKLALRD